MSVYVFVYRNSSMCVCVYTCVYSFWLQRSGSRSHTQTNMIHTYTHYIHARYTHLHTHTHTHTHTHVHIHMQGNLLPYGVAVDTHTGRIVVSMVSLPVCMCVERRFSNLHWWACVWCVCVCVCVCIHACIAFGSRGVGAGLILKQTMP